MERSVLVERVAAWSRWHYAIDLGQGVVTPIFDPAHAIRHRERKRHFFDPVVRWIGGLEGCSVLDLGCNAGFWSLAATRAGAGQVVGIDGRQMHVDQASLVFEALQIEPERWQFRVDDVRSCELGGPWQLVLCLGLLYHVDDPLGLLDRIVETGPAVVVLDSEVHPAPGARSRRGVETPEDPRSAVGTTSIRVPTVAALAQRMRAHGYDVVVLRPGFSDWSGSEDYHGGWRRALVCSRGLDQGTLAVERERETAPLRQSARWLRWALSRARSRLA